MRGNYTLDKIGENVGQGSPPRARELQVFHDRYRVIDGITPACAGIT